MTTYQGPDRRLDGIERRAISPEISELLSGLRELRKQVHCIQKTFEPFEPMLQEMLDGRKRMVGFRWTMFTVLGGTVVTGAVSFLGFIGYLIWEWLKHH